MVAGWRRRARGPSRGATHVRDRRASRGWWSSGVVNTTYQVGSAIGFAVMVAFVGAALCAGLGLVPLVLAGGEPGNELQAPMAVVILGGLVSSTALNLIVIPAFYSRFARPRSA